MICYLDRFDATPESERWGLVRRWMFEETLPFFAELRRNRPILVTPEATLVARYHDCQDVLRRHDTFSVALYKPKQGDYWMAQDDTPIHWREKSIMRAVLDREQIPEIRTWIGETTAAVLAKAGGRIDAVEEITRAIPIALVQHWFGFEGVDPKDLREWSFWNQY